MTDFDTWYKTVPEDRNDTMQYDLRRAYYTLPHGLLESWRTASPEMLRYTTWQHLPSVDMNGRFLKKKSHPSVLMELEWYNSKDGEDFRKQYKLIDDPNDEYYRYEKLENGGWFYFIKKHQEGGKVKLHKVASGDTMSAIALANGLSTDELMFYNPNVNPNAMKVGSILNLGPVERKHTVRNGDYLGKIANQYGVSIEDIKKANGMKDDVIYAGKEIIIPGLTYLSLAAAPVFVTNKTEGKAFETPVPLNTAISNIKQLLIALENPYNKGYSTYKGQAVWFHSPDKGDDKHAFAIGLDDRNKHVQKVIRYTDDGRPYITADDAEKTFNFLLKDFLRGATDRMNYAKKYAEEVGIPFKYNPVVHDLVTNLNYQKGVSTVANHKELFENDEFLRTVASGDEKKVAEAIAQFYERHGYNERARNLRAFMKLKNGGYFKRR